MEKTRTPTIGFAAQRLTELAEEGLVGAAYAEKGAQRLAGGPRRHDRTRASLSCAREDTFPDTFPVLEPRRMAEKARRRSPRWYRKPTFGGLPPLGR
jgi:hypothetical protein